MLQNNNVISLKPYFKRFFWLYSGLTIAIVVILHILDSCLGLNLKKYVGGAIINFSILPTTTVTISKQFAKKYQRFFNSKELKKMIVATTLLSFLFQTIVLAIYLAVNFIRFATNTHYFWICLLALVFVLVPNFIMQLFNFYLIAKRAVNKMNLG